MRVPLGGLAPGARRDSPELIESGDTGGTLGGHRRLDPRQVCLVLGDQGGDGLARVGQVEV